MGEPQSWPTMIAFSSPSASTTPTLSATCCTMPYASMSSGLEERP